MMKVTTILYMSGEGPRSRQAGGRAGTRKSRDFLGTEGRAVGLPPEARQVRCVRRRALTAGGAGAGRAGEAEPEPERRVGRRVRVCGEPWRVEMPVGREWAGQQRTGRESQCRQDWDNGGEE